MALTLALVLLPASMAADGYQITAPEEEECVFGNTTFEATYSGKDTGGVQWAVRYGTCDPAQNTVFGNVDGFNDDYTWEIDGEQTRFSATADTSDWTLGNYCFVFNPNNGGRYTRWFVVGEYGAEWLPPISLDDWTLNENATLPIKFQLLDCDGDVITEELDPSLTVYFGDDGEAKPDLRFDEDEYHYIGLFRSVQSSDHRAVVYLNEVEVGCQPFVVEHPGEAGGRGGRN